MSIAKEDLPPHVRDFLEEVRKENEKLKERLKKNARNK